MNKNIVLAAVLSAMLLTGCSSEVQPAKTEQDVTVSAEAADNTETVTTAEKTVSKVKSKYSEELPENMRLFRFAKLNSEGEYTAVNQNVEILVNGNILCASCRITNSDGTASRNVLRFYSIDDEAVEKTIRFPDSYKFEEFIGCNEDILCKAKLTHYISRGGVSLEEYSVITVKNDYTFEYSEYTPQNAALSYGGRNITQWYLDIVDADRDMKLVEGFESEGDIYSIETFRSNKYMFPIDENRFVYLTEAYEYTPCFGIYDLETDTASDVPNSENLMPLGIHNGKIYSTLKPWGKTASDIYAADIETLETERIMPALAAEHCFCKMPESGDKIVYLHDPTLIDGHNIIGVADPDTGESKEYELPYGNEFGNERFYFADNDTVVIISDNMDKALVIDLNN